MEFSELKTIVEALVFAADGPLMPTALRDFGDELNGGHDLDSIMDALNEDYQASGRAFQIVRVGGGYQITTRPEYAAWIRRMYTGRTRNRLSQAALETLSIIAFKQPISKTEISAIRGVNSDGVVRSLLERRLITISGRAAGLGRSLLYSTTPEFLQYFGINDISDLPRPREIEELFGEGKYADQIIDALSRTDDGPENQDGSAIDADVEKTPASNDDAAE